MELKSYMGSKLYIEMIDLFKYNSNILNTILDIKVNLSPEKYLNEEIDFYNIIITINKLINNDYILLSPINIEIYKSNKPTHVEFIGSIKDIGISCSGTIANILMKINEILISTYKFQEFLDSKTTTVSNCSSYNTSTSSLEFINEINYYSELINNPCTKIKSIVKYQGK